MPRIYDDRISILKIEDNISNSELQVGFRQPETPERLGFSNESITRKGKKIKFASAQARLKYGLRIIEWIRDGDFIIQKKGKLVPISSEEKSPNYDPQWKQKMETNFSDIVMLLGAHVFEDSAEALDEEVLEEEEEKLTGEDAEKN